MDDFEQQAIADARKKKQIISLKATKRVHALSCLITLAAVAVLWLPQYFKEHGGAPIDVKALHLATLLAATVIACIALQLPLRLVLRHHDRGYGISDEGVRELKEHYYVYYINFFDKIILKRSDKELPALGRLFRSMPLNTWITLVAPLAFNNTFETIVDILEMDRVGIDVAERRERKAKEKEERERELNQPIATREAAKEEKGEEQLVKVNIPVTAGEAVDLGLSVKWSTSNVGAKNGLKYGDYYTWDEALQLLADGWRVPTDEEQRELMKECIWNITTLEGVRGYIITASNGNHIFLPAAGYYTPSGELHNQGTHGYYWSSSTMEGFPDEAIELFFTNQEYNVPRQDFRPRNAALTIRPVKE